MVEIIFSMLGFDQTLFKLLRMYQKVLNYGVDCFGELLKCVHSIVTSYNKFKQQKIKKNCQKNSWHFVDTVVE